LITDQYILANGKRANVTAMENSYGQMAHSMKVIGEMIWRMEKED